MAEEEIPSAWKTNKGLLLEGADVTITDFVFLVDNEYAAGALVASVTWTPDEYEGDISTLRPQLYSLGQGWRAVDKGARAEHESGKHRDFSARSSFGSLINAVVEIGPEVIKYFGDKDPRDADTWIGTKWTLGSVEYETQDKKKKDRLVPVAFLGVEGNGDKTAAKAPAKAAVAKKGTPAPKPAPKAAGLDEDTETALKELAVEHDNYDAFMNAGFEWMEANGKAGDSAVETAVMNKRQWAAWRAS